MLREPDRLKELELFRLEKTPGGLHSCLPMPEGILSEGWKDRKGMVLS